MNKGPLTLSGRSQGAILFICSLFFSFSTIGQSAQTFSLSPAATKTLVDSLANQLEKFYVIKEKAPVMSAYLRKRNKSGAYNKINDPHILAGLLTADVLTVQKDEHFHVEYNPVLANELLGNVEDVPKMVADKLNSEKQKNFGFKKAEILNGNIGYLEISTFSRLNDLSKKAADAALQFLSNSNALILDLRYGTGGSPDMVNHLLSHFFKDKTHVTDIYIRSENTTLPYWTKPDSSYGHLREMPLYVLTSYKTFSAAEGFIHALKTLKRATIIGEKTRGGAHTVTYRPLSSGFIADIPFGKALTPGTSKNWEGEGIEPDVTVPAEKALEEAEKKIFDYLLAQAKDTVSRNHLEWERQFLLSVNNPLTPDSTLLTSYMGTYGPFHITLSQGTLYYQKTGKARFPLIAMSPQVMRAKGNDTFIVEFLRDPSGKINKISTRYDDGRIENANRIK